MGWGRSAKAGYRTLSLEAHEDKSLAALLVPPLRKLLFELDRLAGAGDKAKRALAVLKGFMSGLKVKLGDIEVGLDPVLPRSLAFMPSVRQLAELARFLLSCCQDTAGEQVDLVFDLVLAICSNPSVARNLRARVRASSFIVFFFG